MTQTVVGLFDDRSDAQRAIEDLRKSGFRDGIQTITSASESADALRDLTSSISEPDVRFYQEGVRRGGTLVTVFADEGRAVEAARIMTRYNMVDVDTRTAEYNSTGGSFSLRDYHDQDVVLPVIEEELQVSKRTVESGRMRVYTRVTERPVEQQVTLRDEKVHVERRPVDRAVDGADADRLFQERSIEATETGEEAVVRKRARVIEEVVIRREAREHTETIRDNVRRTQVDVDQTQGTSSSVSSSNVSSSNVSTGYDAFDSDFRSYHSQNLANSGYSYDEYNPVFRYGHTLGSDERYSSSDWTTVEPDARRHWEEQNPGTWDQFKDAVRYSWDKARGKR